MKRLLKTKQRLGEHRFKRIYTLEFKPSSFKEQLRNAPIRGEFQGTSNVVIQLPNAEGKLERFSVLETPIMEKGLAEVSYN